MNSPDSLANIYGETKYTEILIASDEYQYVHNGQIIPAPEDAHAHLAALLTSISAQVKPHENEAHVECEGRNYRASRLPHRGDNNCWILRLLPPSIPEPHQLGFNEQLTEWIINQPHGMVLFSGPAAAGKTTSCSAFLAERLKKSRGLAVTVEDPPELDLTGSHGEGRCVQLDAGQLGGWDQACQRVLRYGALSSFMLGEIRTPESAMAALNSSLNGSLAMATIHSPGIAETVNRFLLVLRREMDEENARVNLADMLRGVIFQRLVQGADGNLRLNYQAVIAAGEDEDALKSAIRTKGPQGPARIKEIADRQSKSGAV